MLVLFPGLQFMLIFRYAKEGTLEIEGLKKIAATCDVTTEGVGGAKTFFEAKAKEVSIFIARLATNEIFYFLLLRWQQVLNLRRKSGQSKRRKRKSWMKQRREELLSRRRLQCGNS